MSQTRTHIILFNAHRKPLPLESIIAVLETGKPKFKRLLLQ